MGTWNHRVLVHKHELEIYFQIHEVYYNKKGDPESYTENGVAVGGDGYSELQWVLSKMQECLTKPVLDVNNWPAEYEGKFIKTK